MLYKGNGQRTHLPKNKHINLKHKTRLSVKTMIPFQRQVTQQSGPERIPPAPGQYTVGQQVADMLLSVPVIVNLFQTRSPSYWMAVQVA